MKKENKYDHVGRPTNEEVKARKNKTLLKVGCGLALVLVAIFGIVFSINNSNLNLLKGSSTSSTMLKVQKNSKIKRVQFRPDYINADKTLYVSKHYNEKYGTFSNYLFNVVGFEDYKWDKIYVYNDGKLIYTVKPNSKFGISSKYLGKTLAMKIVAIKKNKKYSKYLRLYVPSDLKNAPRCTIIPDSIMAKDQFGRNKVVKELSSKNKTITLYAEQWVIFSIKGDSYGVGFKFTPIFDESSDAKLIESNSSASSKKLKLGEIQDNGKRNGDRYIYYLTYVKHDTGNKEYKYTETSYFWLRPFKLTNKKGINAVETNKIKIVAPSPVG